MTNEQIFERHFKEGMIVNDFKAFKKSHPTLLKVILKAMDEANPIKKTCVSCIHYKDNFDCGQCNTEYNKFIRK